MTEAELQTGVIELARLLGYRVAHFRPAKTEQGWRTPVQADGKGFPDLVLVGRGRVLFVELKSDKGIKSPDQEAWQSSLDDAGALVFTWRPSMWSSGAIEQVLRGRDERPSPREVFAELCAAVDVVLDRATENYVSDELDAAIQLVDSLIGPG